MTPERWAQIRRIFDSAVERAGGDRSAYLADVCRGDDELLRNVESLLAQTSTDFLQPLEPPSEHPLPARIGRYRILNVIGEGGMGTVYQAEQEQPRRIVALKVIKVGRASAELVRRFALESEVLARLQHPGIAQIYEAGTADEGYGPQPFFAMEFIRGQSLREFAAGRALSIRQRLELMAKICDAVDHAHQRGIVHRDLKPGNILVDQAGQPKILDFGVARVTDSDTKTACQTDIGQLIGTLAYMSPEQVMGDPAQLDARSDIYALGVILYELLAGKLPYPIDNKRLHEAMRTIAEDDPPPLSSINRAFRGDIETIAQKALEKDKHRRYASGAALAGDLMRYLRDEPITARPASSAYRLRKFVRRHKPMVMGLAAGLLVLVLGLIAFAWLRPKRLPGPEQWVQLTRLPDSVSQPALSRDGRKVAFIRGPSTFAGAGQIYVKPLPDGEALQLTHDTLSKMSPVFSPDGSQIAYTAVNEGGLQWDTWTVPAAGGEARRWLLNASGLVWSVPNQILFSEIKNHDVHMGIVAADDQRRAARDIYLPSDVRAMAHRSYPSPDGKWVLLVEMDPKATWLNCRLVPLDGHSTGRPVGPQAAGCTSAAWSPDGRWMYFSSAVGGAFHIWRQRFPDGRPQQITSGLTEEEGIAMASDGRSFITAVGLRQSAVWLHEAGGDRQVSIEGYSYDPKFTSDGKRLCYRILKGADPSGDPSELHVLELSSGRSEPILPGLRLSAGQMVYDVSRDGRQVVAAVADREGKSRLWLAPIDRNSPPRQIPGVEGNQPLFDSGGAILFTGAGASNSLYRIRADGTALQKVIDEPVRQRGSLSPDGRLLAARLIRSGGVVTVIYPLDGGTPLRMTTPGGVGIYVKWSQDGSWIYLMIPGSMFFEDGRTYAVPLAKGKLLPEIPPDGFQTEEQLAALPGVRRINAFDVAPGPDSDTYAFARQTVERNLYRIPIP
jgi:Tol biopolymer transport system component/predicted Ser/Thr protein kinase